METLTPEWAEYASLDSGDGRKLERFGNHVLVRPEPQATWKAQLGVARWDAADGEFVKGRATRGGEWKFRKEIAARWEMRRKDLRFWVHPVPSGHVGVFPDQACHWDWIAELTKRAAGEVKALSLFGHTGLATLAAAGAGAKVTHIDASRQAIELARENQSLSGMKERPIRWIAEDALTFVRREARRGNRYNAMMIDPPRFGRGPDGEVWKLEESLPELLKECGKLLDGSPVFVLLNVYTTVVTQGRAKGDAQQLRAVLENMLKRFRATVSSGELALQDGAQRQISTSVFARADFRNLD